MKEIQADEANGNYPLKNKYVVTKHSKKNSSRHNDGKRYSTNKLKADLKKQLKPQPKRAMMVDAATGHSVMITL